MMGEKINATGMTGFVSEERTRSQWGRRRREKSAYMLKCQVHRCMREARRIFVFKLMHLCVSRCIQSLRDIPPSQTLQGWEKGGAMGRLAVSPCRWQGLSALSQRVRWTAGWWWCTRVWMRWQGRTGNHMQAWIHTEGKGNKSHTYCINHAHTQSASTSNNH